MSVTGLATYERWVAARDRVGVLAGQLAVVARHVPAEYSDDVSEFVPHTTVRQLRRVLPKYPFAEQHDAPDHLAAEAAAAEASEAARQRAGVGW